MNGGRCKTSESQNVDHLIRLIKPGWQQGEQGAIVAEEMDGSAVRKLTTVSKPSHSPTATFFYIMPFGRLRDWGAPRWCFIVIIEFVITPTPFLNLEIINLPQKIYP